MAELKRVEESVVDDWTSFPSNRGQYENTSGKSLNT